MNTLKSKPADFKKFTYKKYCRNFSKAFLLIIAINLCLLMSFNSFAQTREDTTDWRFHDDLLNHLVGKWNVTGITYGEPNKETLEADWVMDHQYLRIHEKSKEIIPEINGPFET